VGDCPLLEQLDISDNQIETIQKMAGCLSIRTFDCSFNKIASAKEIKDSLQLNREITHLKINDNPAVTGKDLEPFLSRVLPSLQEINDKKV